MAGLGVALVFLFTDALQLAPLRTPQVLAGLTGSPGVGDDTGTVTHAASMALMGFRLTVYTVLHLVVFALVGVVGSFVIPTATLARTLVSGVVFGATACTAVFYGSRLMIVDAPVLLHQGVSLASVVGANALAGLILGGGLFLLARPGLEEEPAGVSRVRSAL
jgi:hypothetical protein